MRWGFVFVACPLPLTEEQRLGLVRLAAEAWFENRPEVRFDWPDCVGSVRPGSDVVTMGTFVGQQFFADVELPTRSGRVSFLVAEAQLRQPGQVAEA